MLFIYYFFLFCLSFFVLLFKGTEKQNRAVSLYRCIHIYIYININSGSDQNKTIFFVPFHYLYFTRFLCSSSHPDMFNITNTRGKVAKFCIFKTVYRLGEDIVGTFNFSEGDIPCLQVSLLCSCSIAFQYLFSKTLRMCFLVFGEPAKRGGDPAAVPAATRTGRQRDRTRPAPGVLPPHRLQPLLSAHTAQRHAGLQHRHRSVGGSNVKLFKMLSKIPKVSDHQKCSN